MQIKLKNIKFWSDIPDYWKATSQKGKVKFEKKPTDKGLSSIMGEFASDDDLRPQMTGIFFDKQNIVTTDAHKLFIIPNDSDYDGLYEIGSNTKMQYNFPNYKVILTDYPERNAYEVDILKLKTYLNALLKSEAYNETIAAIHFAVGETGDKIAFDGRKLMSILEGFEKLGYYNIYIGYDSPTRAPYFSINKEYVKSPFVSDLKKLKLLFNFHHLYGV